MKLKLDAETLKCIKLRNRERHDICLHDMLLHRLQSIGSLTWHELCDCLKSPIVDRIDVASEIEKLFQGDYHSKIVCS